MRKLTLLALVLIALFAFMSPPGHHTAARASTATVGMTINNTYWSNIGTIDDIVVPSVTPSLDALPQTANEAMNTVGTTSVDNTLYTIANVPKNAHKTFGDMQVSKATSATKTVLKCPMNYALFNVYATNVHRHALII